MPNCKLCQSAHRDEIKRRLHGGEGNAAISRWLSAEGAIVTARQVGSHREHTPGAPPAKQGKPKKEGCCAVARHPLKDEIEQRLAAGGIPGVIKQWLAAQGKPLSPAVLSRHRRHMTQPARRGLSHSPFNNPAGKVRHIPPNQGRRPGGLSGNSMEYRAKLDGAALREKRTAELEELWLEDKLADLPRERQRLARRRAADGGCQ